MKKFLSLFAAIFFAACMMAADVTVTKSVHDLFPDDANGTQEATLYSDANLSISVNPDGNNGKVYGTGTEWRLYQTNSPVVTVAATDATIKTVAFEFTVKNTGVLNFGESAMTSNVAVNVNAASAEFVVANSSTATNGQVIIKGFTVVYEASGEEPAASNTMTVYCQDAAWWAADGAAVGIYTWDDNGTAKVAWPGERMTAVEGEDGVWSFELDTTVYHMCIFTRVNGSGDIADWGAKTGDLTIPTDGKNLFTITNTTGCWKGEACACSGVWSVYGEEAPEPPTPVEVAYYLVGTLNGWTADDAYKFSAAETEGEYLLHTTLAENDEIKVIKVDGETTTWYPAEGGNYIVDAAHAGEKDIYFRPAGNEAWAEFGGYIWMGENQPAPIADEWDKIVWMEAAAADDIAEDASYTADGSDFALTLYDAGNKMAIDANDCRFGTAEAYEMYNFRIKSGGASSSTKNYFMLNIPAAGTLRIAPRTGSNSATDRALVITQGETDLYNAIVQESQAVEVTENEQTVKVYPYVEVAVEAGSVRVSYTAGMNFYGFAFKAAGETPEPQDPTAAVIGSMTDWEEAIPFVLSDDKSYAYLTGNISAGEYNFKFIINGEWRSNGYRYHRGFPGAAGISENNGDNMVFVADVDGEYTFEWFFANDSAAITYPAIPFTCDWENIAWLGGSNDQIKVCKESEAIGVVNVQNPHWSEDTEDGIYMTFPSAAWGAISLAEGQYETQGAGMLVYLSALTQEYNEISVVCENVEYIITVYNAANAPAPATPDYYLVGTLNEWTADDAYKFGKDETCAEGEFVLYTTLAEDDEIKVIKVDGETTTWYPAEGGNYVVDAAHAGEKAIYFRPAGNEAWAAFGGYFWIGENPAVLDAPDAAPAAPTYAGYQVHAVYSATYNADCNFGDWGSGTVYTQEEYGKKYVTTNLGYFGLEFTGMDCSEMEALHLDIWSAEDASIRIVPIHGGTEVGVTAMLEGQKWNSINIALSDFTGVTDWSNVYQIKIDNAAFLTFWLNNVYFYTTQEKVVDLVDGFYMIGSMNDWDIHNLTAEHMFAANPDNEGEFVLHYTLAEGNEFKVVAVADNALGAWYPGEAGNFVVDYAHAGEKDIYFRPDYQGGTDWHASCIYVAATENANPWETWFATGDTWNTETESYLTWNAELQKAFVHINVDKYGQWRAQAKYHGPVAEAGKCYHVALKMKANNAINNVTIKYQDNVEMVYVADAALAANVEFVFDTIVAGLDGGNGIMVLDFGYAHMGDVIEIYDIVIEEAECPATRLEDGYYLIGLDMTDWTVDNITEDYLLTVNPENAAEYMIPVTLIEGQEFKVVSVAHDAITTWYPDGVENNYVVDVNHAGATTIYFRPDGQGGNGWHYGVIYVVPTGTVDIDNTNAEVKAVKFIRNGQLFIEMEGKLYNAQGVLVR